MKDPDRRRLNGQTASAPCCRYVQRHIQEMPMKKCSHDEGKIMSVMDYRTQNGLADYGFSIEFQSTVGWRVYIVFQPLYQGNDDNSQWPYRGTDRNGRSYVNWSAKLDNLSDAKTVAKLWAEISERHQRDQELIRSANGAIKSPSAVKRRRPDAA
jgi:hypothetical protein